VDDESGLYVASKYIPGMALVILFGVYISRFFPNSWLTPNNPEPIKTEEKNPEEVPKPEASETRENDQKERMLRNSLLTGAQLIRTYRDDEREMKRLKEALEFTHDEGDAVNFNKFQKGLRDAAERKRLTFRMYLQALGELQSKFSQHELQSALSLLGAELAVDGKPSSLAQFPGLFVSQAESFRQQSGIDEETIGKNSTSLR
jgi:hypothetical protein